MAIFNIGSKNNNDDVNMMIGFDALGMNNKYKMCKNTDAWTKMSGNTDDRVIEERMNINDTILYYLSDCQ